ncbi:hypothetical protein SK128_022686, partial [Halocaridina rubra]
EAVSEVPPVRSFTDPARQIFHELRISSPGTNTLRASASLQGSPQSPRRTTQGGTAPPSLQPSPVPNRRGPSPQDVVALRASYSYVGGGGEGGGSPKASPRGSPKASPRGSPRGTPPKSTPKSSPTLSARRGTDGASYARDVGQPGIRLVPVRYSEVVVVVMDILMYNNI